MPGYVKKELSLQHAELVANHWNLDNWFTETLPYDQKLTFLKDTIKSFGAFGVFTVDNLVEPVAWSFRKSGKPVC